MEAKRIIPLVALGGLCGYVVYTMAKKPEYKIQIRKAGYVNSHVIIEGEYTYNGKYVSATNLETFVYYKGNQIMHIRRYPPCPEGKIHFTISRLTSNYSLKIHDPDRDVWSNEVVLG